MTTLTTRRAGELLCRIEAGEFSYAQAVERQLIPVTVSEEQLRQSVDTARERHASARFGCPGCIARVRKECPEFPLQADRDGVLGPPSIPWPVAERAWAAYSIKYGRDQSVERMAERGGFSWKEMDKLFPAWREAVDEWHKLRTLLEEERRLTAQLRAELDTQRQQAELAERGAAQVSAHASRRVDLFGLGVLAGKAGCLRAMHAILSSESWHRALLLRMQLAEALEAAAPLSCTHAPGPCEPPPAGDEPSPEFTAWLTAHRECPWSKRFNP